MSPWILPGGGEIKIICKPMLEKNTVLKNPNNLEKWYVANASVSIRQISLNITHAGKNVFWDPLSFLKVGSGPERGKRFKSTACQIARFFFS